MKLEEYYLEAVQTPVKLNKTFLTRLITTLIKTKDKKRDYVLHLDPTDSSKAFFYKEDEKVYVEDYKPGVPAFLVNHHMALPAGTLKNQPEAIADTTFGRILVNAVLLDECFGDVIPYINKQFTLGDILPMVNKVMVNSDVDEPGTIKVTDYKKCLTYVRLFKAMTDKVVTTATPKTVVPPTGLTAFKKKLLAGYKPPYSQQDLFEIEEALREYDREWLKEDRSNGIVMAGKARDTARVKMYLTFGSSVDIGGGTAKPTLNSLNERLPSDKDSHANTMDGVRGGAYARGASTVLGGVTTTLLMAASSHLSIIDGDCGTKRTITRQLFKKDSTRWVGMYHVVAKKNVLITEDNIGSLDGKHVHVRSPMRCLSPKGTYCSICSGQNLSRYGEAVQLAMSGISNLIMGEFMSKAHARAVEMAMIDFDTDLS